MNQCIISLKVEENMESIDKLFQEKKLLNEQEIDEFKNTQKYVQSKVLRRGKIITI